VRLDLELPEKCLNAEQDHQAYLKKLLNHQKVMAVFPNAAATVAGK